MNHPAHVGVPDPRTTQGVRAYREKADAHPLQIDFLTEAGERAYVERLRALLADGKAEEADAILMADLAGFDGSLAAIARALRPADVRIDGWEDLMPILDEFEGPPITGITIGLTNEADLVFEANEPREPSVMLGLYSDEVFNFTEASRDALLHECASDMPGWAGHEEDVEFYVDSAGLGTLNTALIQHKHRYFLRDGRDGIEGRAPGGYVEYILGLWVRATRFVQAVQQAANQYGVPEGAKLVAGTVALHTDFAALIEETREVAVERSDIKPLASLTIKRWSPRPDPLMEIEATGSALRQKLGAAVRDDVTAEAPKPSTAPAPSQFAQPAPALVLPTIAPAPAATPAPQPVEPTPDAPPAEATAPAPVAPAAFVATQAPAAPAPAPVLTTFEEKRGFFARLFGRGRD